MSLSITVAAPFRHARKDQLKKNELVYFLVFDRRWMTIEQARLLLDRAEEEGLVAVEGDMVSPLFNIAAVEVPLGFKPSSAIFERADPVQELIRRISGERGMDHAHLVSEMNQLITGHFDGNLLPEAAAVVLARRYGVPCEDLLPGLREHMLKK